MDAMQIKNNLFRIVIFGTILIHLFAHAIIAQNDFDAGSKTHPAKRNIHAGRIFADTEILYSIDLLADRAPLGVTIVDNTVIVSSATNANNFFDRYDLNGTYIDSYIQATDPAGFGYRDLAYDGSYILASDNNNINRIDPVSFAINSFLTNADNSPHRGLAYDPAEDAIYSTNFRSGPLLKINAQTGETINNNGTPSVSPYGIAFDSYSNANVPALWYAEPSRYGTFRISRADINTGRVNYTFDITAKTADPDSALSGGLEVINNHPNYPGRVIAVAVEQHSKKLLFVDISDAPNPLPVELEEVGEFGGFDDEGIITSGIGVNGDYLYCVNNNDVAIYSISADPASPSFNKNVGLSNINKIFINDSHMYITLWNGLASIVSIYSLADPLNPQLMSSYDAQFAIRKIIFHNNFIIISKSNSNFLDVVDVSNKSLPAFTSTYQLPAPIIDLVSDVDRDILFAGYFEDGAAQGIKILDISDMNNLQELDDIGTLGDIPISLEVKNNRLFSARNWTNGRAVSLNAHDYTDPANVDFLGLTFMSFSNIAWQIKIIDDYIIATLPEEGMHTYYWDEQAAMFLAGPTLQLPEPREFVVYTQSQSLKKTGYIQNDPTNTKYVYCTNGYALLDELAGSEKNKIIKIDPPPPPPAGMARLTMGIEPSQAASEGCKTEPAGTKDYTVGVDASIKAIPNAEEGWNFTHWTGDASGDNPETSVTMDEDKEAIAHFVKPQLNVISPGPGRKVLCPEEAHQKFVKIMDVELIANEVADWRFTSIFFKNLNSKKSIKSVRLTTPTGNTGGLINVDTTEFSFVLAPGITIPKGGTITVTFYIEVELPPVDQMCEMNEMREYRVAVERGRDVTAIPIDFSNGKKVVSAGDSYRTFISCVENSTIWGFNTIQEAIDSELSGDVDVHSVCEGEYNKNVKIDRSHILRSKGSADKTVLNYEENGIVAGAVILLAADKAEVDGFTIRGEKGGASDCINSDAEKKDLAVKNNVLIDGFRGLYFYKPMGNSTIKNNTIRKSEKYGKGILLTDASNVTASNNTIENSTVGIELTDNSKVNTIDQSTIRNSDTPISVEDSDSNVVKNADVYEAVNTTRLVNLSNKSKGNTFDNIIDHNSKSYISLEFEIPFDGKNFEGYSNNFTNNKFHTLRLNKAINSTFTNNTIATLIANGSNKNTFAYNKISNPQGDGVRLNYCDENEFNFNSIENCKEYGVISIKGSKNLFNANLINSNSKAGIRIGDGWGTGGIENRIYRNVITKNKEEGIILDSSPHVQVMYNTINENIKQGVKVGVGYGIGCPDSKIISNTITKNDEGVSVVGSFRTEISRNEITQNKNQGIYLHTAHNIRITQNRISGHNQGSLGIAINGFASNKMYIVGNICRDNCTGMRVFTGGNHTIKNNKVKNNWCFFTGIHLSNVEAILEGNDITENAGAGILFDQSFTGSVKRNNIYDNLDLEISNETKRNTIDVSDNFWGEGSAPIDEMISGDFEIGTWLSDPVGIVMSFENDSTFALPGQLDSVTVSIMNHRLSNDQIRIEITDEQNWLTGSAPIFVNVDDTTASQFGVHYRIPSDIADEVNNKIVIKATSLNDTRVTGSDSLHILNYSPELAYITIQPDSISIDLSDSLVFNAIGFDQKSTSFNGEMNVKWEFSAGERDSLGIYRPGDTEGLVLVTATDSISGIEGTATINVVDFTNGLALINVVPDSVLLRPGETAQFLAEGYSNNGFPFNFNPVWISNGGDIDPTGVFIAGDVPGIYEIYAENSDGSIIGMAYATILDTVTSGITSSIVPKKYYVNYNYPNPFNPTTTISYGLPFASTVIVEVFNILGQRVATLVNMVQKAGTKEIVWDAGNFSSGLYLLRINAKSVENNKSEFNSIRKMMLLK